MVLSAIQFAVFSMNILMVDSLSVGLLLCRKQKGKIVMAL
jgi:hypothetical protein